MSGIITSTRATVSNFIKSKILLSGPIPVADYMRLALTAQPLLPKDLQITKDSHSGGGYYMERDVFGQQGDFITSPEISQLFGEMLAVWGLQTWMQIGGPKKFSIVELGPGRGTLSKDILRVFKRFKHITGDDVSLHLVEISPFLATLQCASLAKTEEMKKTDAKKNAAEIGNLIKNQEVKTESTEQKQQLVLDPMKESLSGEPFYHHTIAGETGFPIYWYRNITDLPLGFHFYIAHEFFDALPIHKLQKVGNEWREVLIDVNPEEESTFRFVISRNETPVIKLLQQNYPSLLKDSRHHIEISVEGIAVLDNITNRLTNYGGLSTIIDYGHNGTKEDTFRAFCKHKLHNPLVDPGKADLTADLDFSIIKKLFDDRAMICGPVTQRDFLDRIGIRHRLQMLVDKCKLPDEREALISGVNMIMDDMGSRFQVMTLLPNILKKVNPDLEVAGFSPPPPADLVN